MNTQIRERTDRLHADALARYALALDDGYQAATRGWSVSNTGKLRRMALALLGSPYHRINERAWSDPVMDWLLSLEKGNTELLTASRNASANLKAVAGALNGIPRAQASKVYAVLGGWVELDAAIAKSAG